MQNKLKVRRNNNKGCFRKWFWGCFVYISAFLLLLLTVVFVIVPMAFKYSVGIQRSLIFPTFVISPKNYSNIQNYPITGVRNFYINVKDENVENVTLGVWQILPDDMLRDVIENHEYNFDGAFDNENYNVLLYLHGNGADRSAAIALYSILRKYFHVFAVDYRGYADSSTGEMTEDYMVNDVVYVYKWLRQRTKSNIFVWGHSLGTGVGTHLVANLKEENITPSGLILETPFSSVTDVMKLHPIVQFYSFLPWCKSTFLDPIVKNGLDFDCKKYILNVDCPIMILHAKDDTIIPYELATKLYNIAVNERNSTYQGNVTFHLYEELGYDHMYIYKAPELPAQIKTFVTECVEFARKISTNIISNAP